MNSVYWLAASLVPMLGATVTLREGAAIGVCAIVMVSLHQVLLAPLRQRLANWAYVLASLLLLAALASCLQLALRAWLLPLAIALGHYPALLCLPCLAYDHLLPDQAAGACSSGTLALCLASACCSAPAAKGWLS